MEIREVGNDEEAAQAGAVTARAWRELTSPIDGDREVYLERIGDVAGRARLAPVYVAVRNGRIVGSVTIDLDGTLAREDLPPDEAMVRMLGVEPRLNGQGIGRALTEACLARARAAGKRTVTLFVDSRSAGARHLYESMGFLADPAHDHQVSDGFTLLAYRLAL